MKLDGLYPGTAAAMADIDIQQLYNSNGNVRWVLSALAAAAFIAVWRFRVGVIPVIVVCAAVGVAEALLT